MNYDLNPDEFIKRISSLERAVGSLNKALNETTDTVVAAEDEEEPTSTPITEYGQQNLIRNGDFDLDRNRYLYDTDVTGTTGVDADVSEEAAHWFTVASGGSGLDEDSTDIDSDTNAATNSALKTSAHSLYGSTINDPDYDKENGWVRLGSTNWLCAPLPFNFIKPSKQFFLSFIYKLANTVGGLSTYQPALFAGPWDNTSGQQKFIEGENITLTSTAVGSPAATISREYFVVFETDSGVTFGSTLDTEANAPQDAHYATGVNYVALSWVNEPVGAIASRVYRKTSGTVHYLGDAYPASSYNDNGSVVSTYGGSYPPVDFTRETAYISTNSDNPAPASTDAWKNAQFNIPVPSSYDQSLTTGTQWVIIGLETAISGAGATRALLIDLVSIDDKFGTFTRCPLDFLAKRGLSASPSSGNQGTTGTGGEAPPIGPGRTGYCPVFEMPVLIQNRKTKEQYEIPAIELIDNEDKYLIINRKGIAVTYKAKVSPRPQVIYELVSENEKKLKCSEDHPVFIDEFDRVGKPLLGLKNGDTILTREGLTRVITNVRLAKRRHTVFISVSGREKGFWINGFGGHNLKLPEDFN